MKLYDLELAFDFVSSAHPFENIAYVSKSTGETYWRSDLAGEDDLPEGYEDDEDLVEIPHKNDLDLGQHLVWEFVNRKIPDHKEAVRGIFSRKGAYGRFKSLLERLELLDDWYTFEETRTREALLEWCAAHGIDVEP